MLSVATGLILLTFSYAEPLTVGYLQENAFELQNTYLLNYFKQVENSGLVTRDSATPVKFQTQSFRTAEELQKCLATSECQASLDYSGILTKTSAL